MQAQSWMRWIIFIAKHIKPTFAFYRMNTKTWWLFALMFFSNDNFTIQQWVVFFSWVFFFGPINISFIFKIKSVNFFVFKYETNQLVAAVTVRLKYFFSFNKRLDFKILDQEKNCN